MTPRAEAALASGPGTRTGLGDPGEETDTGLEAAALTDGTLDTLAAEVARRRKTFCGLHSIRNG